MGYQKTTWTNNVSSLNKTKMDNIENGIEIAAPTGALIKWPTSTPPTGWLERDGSAISRTVYADLFALIGTTFGAGDGSTTFNVPDDRGLFERNWDHGKGVDVARTLNSTQNDGNKSHIHTNSVGTESAQHTHTQSGIPAINSNGGSGGTAVNPSYYNPPALIYYYGSNTESTSHIHLVTINADGNTEVTVKNRAYMPIIKY